jgi:hypothetical protein
MGSVSVANQSAAEALGWSFLTGAHPDGGAFVVARSLVNGVGREVHGGSVAEVVAAIAATESYRKDAGKTDHKS